MSSGSQLGSAAGVASHADFQRLPVYIELKSLDRADYRVHDPFAFRIELKNVGKQAVILPWEPDASQVVATVDAPVFSAVIVVDVEGSDGRQTVPIAPLYGSKASPNSAKILAPGARFEIIASGYWTFLPSAANRGGTVVRQGPVAATARISFLSDIDGHMYRDLISTNTVRVELNSRKE